MGRCPETGRSERRGIHRRSEAVGDSSENGNSYLPGGMSSIFTTETLRITEVTEKIGGGLVWKIKTTCRPFFTTDYTDFNGFHGVDSFVLTNHTLIQKGSVEIVITLS